MLAVGQTWTHKTARLLLFQGPNFELILARDAEAARLSVFHDLVCREA